MARMSVGRAVDLFITHLTATASPRTLIWYRAFLQDFRKAHGVVPCESITPAIVERWIARRYAGNAPSTQHGAGRTVVRLFNWAVQEGLITRTPLANYTKPTPSNREIVLSYADYAVMLKAAEGPIKNVVKFVWHTGCRPQEVRAVEAAWIRGRKIVFPVLKSKGKKKRRTIYLDDLAARLVTFLASRHPTGPVFRDRRGLPWTSETLRDDFAKLRRDTGIPGLVCYAIRHSWITHMLEKGVDVATVAALAGNSPATIMQCYCHVCQDEDRLLRELG
jgi:site-specific recombinase XerD